MFIVLEGIDGCGKSTQAKLLGDWLKSEGYSVLLTAEPTHKGIGSFVREILASGEEIDPMALALLFTADRCEHLRNEIEPALAVGKVVISERYYYSTVAYQAAQGVSWDWLLTINSYALNHKPDLVFLLDVGPDFALPKIQEKDRRFLERIQNLKKKVLELRKQYLNKRKMLRDRLGSKKAAQTLVGLTRALEDAEEEYIREKSKYLKFRRFERPTTLESDAEKYDVFLNKVRRKYLNFSEMIRLDGTQPVEDVFEEIKVNVLQLIKP